MRSFRWNYFLATVLLVAAAEPCFADKRKEQGQTKTATATAEANKAPKRAAMEKAFSEKLSGATLVGHFSVTGQKTDKPPRPERYEIESATKLPQNDYWVFLARVKYGDKDVKVPITLKVLWAGDTPMISLTDLTIPGLGTFTSRVMFYGERYAGTWQHGQVGGHLWGTIEQAKIE